MSRVDVSRDDVLAALAAGTASSTDDSPVERQAAAERRRAFRMFVKANHPDTGGDPEAFVHAVREYRDAERRGDIAANDPRLDGPIVFVRDRGLIRAALALIRRTGVRRRVR